MNIPNISQDQASSLWYYDDETGKLFNRTNRSSTARAGDEAGGLAKYSNGARYRRVRIGEKKYMTHQIIWLMRTGEWPTQEIDHINGNTLDNRIENLRLVSNQENKKNKALYKNNTTGIPGVSFVKGRYLVSICGVYHGSFAVKEEAAARRADLEPIYKMHPNTGKRVMTYRNYDRTATPSKGLR